MAWNPEQYLKFADHRLRPALDLLARIGAERPGVVYDLGCGPGNVTQWLKKRWPDAAVTGLDSSTEMLAAATQKFPDIAWRQADIANWRPDKPADVIFSNAALQWLDDHPRLLPSLYDGVAPGGVLAVQMPRSFDQPSHLLMRQAAEEGSWREALLPVLRANPVGTAADYWRILSAEGALLDIWECEYLHCLRGEDAVLHWMLGTTVRPLLAALPEHWQASFLEDFRLRLRRAYPLEADGTTLFPFRRLFILASRPA